MLLMFRNSEFISSLLGRSVTNENYITFNLEEDSIFRNLRIMTFRKNIGDFNAIDLKKDTEIIYSPAPNIDRNIVIYTT